MRFCYYFSNRRVVVAFTGAAILCIFQAIIPEQATAVSPSGDTLEDKVSIHHKTLPDHEKRLRILEEKNKKLTEVVEALLTNQPRSFFGKDLTGQSADNAVKEVDSLSFTSKGRPVGFFLMPADDRDAGDTAYTNFSNVTSRYAGGAGAGFRVVRLHKNSRTTVASAFWFDGHTGAKNWAGARFLGIDKSPPQGNVKYTLEFRAAGGNVVSITNANFVAMELPDMTTP